MKCQCEVVLVLCIIPQNLICNYHIVVKVFKCFVFLSEKLKKVFLLCFGFLTKDSKILFRIFVMFRFFKRNTQKSKKHFCYVSVFSAFFRVFSCQRLRNLKNIIRKKRNLNCLFSKSSFRLFLESNFLNISCRSCTTIRNSARVSSAIAK